MNSKSGRPITRKRDRLACIECRRRKLRCDRSVPCDACRKRGQAYLCVFEPAGQDQGQVQTEAESRLQRLEHVIGQLLSDKAVGSEAAPHDGNELGITVEPVTAPLRGATHWSAISREIDGLRELITPTAVHVEQEARTAEDDAGLTMLLGGSHSGTLSDVLATFLPPRQRVDSLTSTYFRSRTVCAPFIHSSQFLRLYREFWADPASASPLWISMLFSVCHIASNTLRPKVLDGPIDIRFSLAAAQCLVIGKYFSQHPLSVESLVLYTQSQCLTCHNMPPAVGTLMGILIRLATAMAYHREPEQAIYSPFQCEMRRRTWSLCMQLDLLTSFHLGLPSCVQFPTWDTQPPRNLLDSDFDEQTAELPPSRPASERTDISLYIIKHRFSAVFEKILRHSLRASQADGLDELRVLDQELKCVVDELPADFQPWAMTDSVVDSPATVITRLCVSFMYNKSICVLHRPYISKHRSESQLACCEAAMNLVNGFTDAYSQLMPGGQIESERWFLSSITWHDLLLGSTVLCLLLWTELRVPGRFLPDTSSVLQALAKANSIVMEQVDWRTWETARVQRLIRKTMDMFPDSGTSPLIEEQFDAMNWQEAAPTPPGAASDATWTDLQLLMGGLGDFAPGDNT